MAWELPKIPTHKTVYEWYKTLMVSFSQIFDKAYLEPFRPIFEPLMTPGDELYDKMFIYFLAKQRDRIILPKMETTDIENTFIIAHMEDIIAMRSYALKYKYDMLVNTLPEEINDLYDNYYMHREYDKTNTPEEGSIEHSGTDHVYNNVNVETKEFSTTGDSTQPRLKTSSSRKTLPEGTTDNMANSINTVYGHIITTTPGGETDHFEQTAHGYYNSGSKAKMIEDIRRLLSLNVVDQWLIDMMPVFCLDVYKP